MVLKKDLSKYPRAYYLATLLNLAYSCSNVDPIRIGVGVADDIYIIYIHAKLCVNHIRGLLTTFIFCFVILH